MHFAQIFKNTVAGIAGLHGWRRVLLACIAGIAAALSMAPVYALPLLALL